MKIMVLDYFFLIAADVSAIKLNKVDEFWMASLLWICSEHKAIVIWSQENKQILWLLKYSCCFADQYSQYVFSFINKKKWTDCLKLYFSSLNKNPLTVVSSLYPLYADHKCRIFNAPLTTIKWYHNFWYLKFLIWRKKKPPITALYSINV